MTMGRVAPTSSQGPPSPSASAAGRSRLSEIRVSLLDKNDDQLVVPLLPPKKHPNLVEDTVSFESSPEVPTIASALSCPGPRINNSRLLYVPIKLKCGVRVMCRPNVLANCPSVLQDLQQDVAHALHIFPPSVHALIKRTRIWVNFDYQYGPVDAPIRLNHSTTHHHVGWLLCAQDIPEKAHGIEIYNALDFQRMRCHWNGAGLIMHEFCHLIHQFVLGLDHTQVLETYRRVTADSCRYQAVLRRDWAGLDVEHDMAYAVVNPKEFFAEMSVTYLCGFYPHLDKADKTNMAACSPPIFASTVRERLMAQPEAFRSLLNCEEKRPGPFWKFWCKKSFHPLPCNKFYPFTRGQLREHDPDVYQVMEELWKAIEQWDDELTPRLCSKAAGCYLSLWKV